MQDANASAQAMGKRVMERLDALALCSEVEGALTRRFLTPAHRRAMDMVAQWMREAGMSVRVDPIANVIGRIEGRVPDAPALLLGSHIDTVAEAGKYDGNLGVVGAIEAVAALGQGEPLNHALEVIAFGDEEGVRFPSHLLSSRALVGAVSPAMLDVLDRDGITVRQALQRFDCDPDALPACRRAAASIAAYLELHIEQGPVLQATNRPLAAVTAINGATRMTVSVKGEAGHSGTVPMSLRKDALAAAADMVLAVERIGRSQGEVLVATVGRLEVKPGAPNVVPGDCIFTVDIRSPSDAVRAEAVERVLGEIARLADARGVAAGTNIYYDMGAAQMDARVVEAVTAAIAAIGEEPARLASGAGHDAMAIAPQWPAGMLFVRCKDGISHNPAEAITVADCDVAIRALTEAVRRLDTML